MNTYPKNPTPIIGSTRNIIFPAYRAKSEAGYMYSRKKYTKPKMKFSLNYPALTQDELKILTDFFTQNQGEKFYFTYPLEKTKIVCIFIDDELSISDDGGGYSSLKINLAEV